MPVNDGTRSCCFFTELWDIVAGHTIHQGIQCFVSFVNEFEFIRCRGQINNDMPACQVIGVFATLCLAKVKYYPLYPLLGDFYHLATHLLI